MNANVTYCRKDENEIIHEENLSFPTKVEEDGKSFTIHKIGNEVQESVKVIYSDNFGNYTLQET